MLAGAGLGGMTRYALGTWITARSRGCFALGTFLINISGSFFIGLWMALLTECLQPYPNWRLFLAVRVLGGYTAFSSFEYETLQAVRDGGRWMGLSYVAGGVLPGYVTVWLGAALTARR